MKRGILFVLTVLTVFVLSSCGVEDRRFTYVNYLGLYDGNTYFVVSDQREKNKRDLYRFEDEEFVL